MSNAPVRPSIAPRRSRVALAGVALSITGAGGALAAAFGEGATSTWPAVVLAWSCALLMASLIGLGGSRAGREGAAARRSARLAALAVLLLVGGGLSVALLIGFPAAGARLIWGLPPGAAVLIYVVGILPALIVPSLYAWGFDHSALDPENLERLRTHRAPGSGEES